MKNVLYLILAFVLVLIVWGIVRSLIGTLIGMLFQIGMIILFCMLVYAVFKALTSKQKNVI